MHSYHSRHSCWQYKRLSWLWMRMETRLANGMINRWTNPSDPCQGQSDSPSVSFQEQQVTSSDSLRGQTATPRFCAADRQ